MGSTRVACTERWWTTRRRVNPSPSSSVREPTRSWRRRRSCCRRRIRGCTRISRGRRCWSSRRNTTAPTWKPSTPSWLGFSRRLWLSRRRCMMNLWENDRCMCLCNKFYKRLILMSLEGLENLDFFSQVNYLGTTFFMEELNLEWEWVLICRVHISYVICYYSRGCIMVCIFPILSCTFLLLNYGLLQQNNKKNKIK